MNKKNLTEQEKLFLKNFIKEAILNENPGLVARTPWGKELLGKAIKKFGIPVGAAVAINQAGKLYCGDGNTGWFCNNFDDIFIGVTTAAMQAYGLRLLTRAGTGRVSTTAADKMMGATHLYFGTWISWDYWMNEADGSERANWDDSGLGWLFEVAGIQKRDQKDRLGFLLSIGGAGVDSAMLRVSRLRSPEPLHLLMEMGPDGKHVSLADAKRQAQQKLDAEKAIADAEINRAQGEINQASAGLSAAAEATRKMNDDLDSLWSAGTPSEEAISDFVRDHDLGNYYDEMMAAGKINSKQNLKSIVDKKKSDLLGDFAGDYDLADHTIANNEEIIERLKKDISDLEDLQINIPAVFRRLSEAGRTKIGKWIHVTRYLMRLDARNKLNFTPSVVAAMRRDRGRVAGRVKVGDDILTMEIIGVAPDGKSFLYEITGAGVSAASWREVLSAIQPGIGEISEIPVDSLLAISRGGAAANTVSTGSGVRYVQGQGLKGMADYETPNLMGKLLPAHSGHPGKFFLSINIDDVARTMTTHTESMPLLSPIMVGLSVAALQDVEGIRDVPNTTPTKTDIAIYNEVMQEFADETGNEWNSDAAEYYIYQGDAEGYDTADPR